MGNKYTNIRLYVALFGVLNCMACVVISIAGYNPYPIIVLTTLLVLTNILLRRIGKNG